MQLAPVSQGSHRATLNIPDEPGTLGLTAYNALGESPRAELRAPMVPTTPVGFEHDTGGD